MIGQHEPALRQLYQREAAARRLLIDVAVADMRQVGSSVSGPFDVVLAFDNSLAHLLTDDDLCTALRQFLGALRPGGVFLCSVRDYDKVQRGEPATHSYGVREHHGERFRLRQEWSWDDPMHYRATFIVDRETPDGTMSELCIRSQFYAVSTERLLELMRVAGFQDCRRIEGGPNHEQRLKHEPRAKAITAGQNSALQSPATTGNVSVLVRGVA